jgi:hypothetical protein
MDPFTGFYRYKTGGGGIAGIVELSSKDRRKIKTLETVVLETLATYGERLTHIGPDEHILVLISGSGGSGPEHTFVTEFLTLPTPSEVGVEQIDVVPGDRFPALEKEVQRMKETLDEMNKQLEKSREKTKGDEVAADDLMDVAEQIPNLQKEADNLKKALADMEKQISRSRGRRTTSYRAKSADSTLRRATAGASGAAMTSLVIKVKKGDLDKDVDKLREKAEIVAY